MSEYIKTCELHCREIKKENNAFIVSNAELNGEWFKIKFTKSCNQVPRERGLYSLTFDLGESSYQEGKTYVTKDGEVKKDTPTIWVKDVIELRKLTKEEISKKNREQMGKILGV